MSKLHSDKKKTHTRTHTHITYLIYLNETTELKSTISLIHYKIIKKTNKHTNKKTTKLNSYYII